MPRTSSIAAQSGRSGGSRQSQSLVVEANNRNRWSSNWSFILASIGSAIGFGNIWRFPKLCYEFGGGAFLIPYLAALFFFTIPVVVLEFALGQRFQVGHVRMMSLAAAQVDSSGRPSAGSSAPAGLGWAAVLGTYLLSQFYIALLAITLCYVVASFNPRLPWSDGRAHAFFLATTSPSAGVEESGGLVPNLLAAYASVWLLVTLGAVNSSSSIELMNKIVMPVPFIVLVAFLIRGLTLPGAGTGVLTLLTPDPSYLLNAEVWLAAIGQVCYHGPNSGPWRASAAAAAALLLLCCCCSSAADVPSSIPHWSSSSSESPPAWARSQRTRPSTRARRPSSSRRCSCASATPPSPSSPA